MSTGDDPRFNRMHDSFTFRRLKSDKNPKIKIDERFEKVLKDDRFRISESHRKSSVDKFGRLVSKKNSKKQQGLEEFYELNEEMNDQHENTSKLSSSGINTKIDKVGNKMDMETRLDYLNRLSRGEISDSSVSSSDVEEDEIDNEDGNESDSDDDSDSDDSDSEDDYSQVNTSKKHQHPSSSPQKSLISKYYYGNDEKINEEEEDNDENLEVEADSTKRLAIQNCDWENLKASDILVVLQSFCPVGGSIKRVIVYPSDFGKQQLQLEQQYGPQGIWNEDQNDEDDEDDEDDENDENDGIELMDNHHSHDKERTSKQEKKGDFKRTKGKIGLVIQPESDSETESTRNDQKQGDMDLIKLRTYELNKLRYYFAVAEFDSISTAEAIYKELDGIEFEHSSMVFDLRFIPDDVTFADRDIRDSATDVPAVYEPPDFIVNALQHTNITCTWDSGEMERERKLTNISAWKSLEESDLQQYIASSSDEDEEEGEKEDNDDNDEDNFVNTKSTMKNKKSISAMRKLLLGDIASDSDSDSDGDSDDEVNHDMSHSNRNKVSNHDDFFLEESEQERSLTYIPDLGKDILQKKHLSEETVFEAAKRKIDEKKKLRKEMKKKGMVSSSSNHQQNNEDDGSGNNIQIQNKNKSKKNTMENDGESASTAQLELLFAGDDEDIQKRDYDMRQIIKETKNKNKLKNKKLTSKVKSKFKPKLSEESSMNEEFHINIDDSRFKSLFDGKNSHFGIDRTKTEFKETPGMLKILEEQRKRRNFDDVNLENIDSVGMKERDKDKLKGSDDNDVLKLVDNLKKKFKSK